MDGLQLVLSKTNRIGDTQSNSFSVATPKPVIQNGVPTRSFGSRFFVSTRNIVPVSNLSPGQYPGSFRAYSVGQYPSEDSKSNRLHVHINGQGEPAVSYKLNRLSLRNNRLKFKTAGNLPLILEDFKEYTPM